MLVDAGRRRAGAARRRPRDGHDRAGALPLLHSREDLVENVVADLYDELTGVARGRPGRRPTRRPRRLPAAGVQPRVPALGDHAPRRVRAAVRQCRRRRGRPLHGTPGDGDARRSSPAQRFGGVFAELVARIYAERGFPVPADDELEPRAAGAAARVVRRAARSSCRSASCGVPVLLDPALRDGLHGGLRAPAVRPGRRRADVRGRAAQPAGARVAERRLGVADAVPAAVRLTGWSRHGGGAWRDEAHC